MTLTQIHHSKSTSCLKYVGLTLQLVDQNIYKNLPFSYTFNYNSAGQTCYNFVNPYFSLYVMND